MFHLSKGCLSFMLSRKSLFAAANQKRSTEEKVGGLGDSEAPCIFDFLTNTKPFIVELKRACHLVNQYFLLEIDDSETTAYCIVNQDDVKDNYSNNKDERPQLDVGSVVIVNRIQFVSRIELPKFNLPDDYSNFDPNFLMQIMSYTVIGTTNTEKQANRKYSGCSRHPLAMPPFSRNKLLFSASSYSTLSRSPWMTQLPTSTFLGKFLSTCYCFIYTQLKCF